MNLPQRFLMPVVFVFGVVAGVLVVWLVMRQPMVSSPVVSLPPSPVTVAVPSTTEQMTDVALPPTDEQSGDVPEMLSFAYAKIDASQGRTIEIEFVESPNKLSQTDLRELFESTTTNTEALRKNVLFQTEEEYRSWPYLQAWNVGRVSRDSVFQGDPVFFLAVSQDGLGAGQLLKYLVKHQGAVYELSKYNVISEGDLMIDVNQFIISLPKISVTSLEAKQPSSLTLENGERLDAYSAGMMRGWVYDYRFSQLEGFRFAPIAVTKDGFKVYERLHMVDTPEGKMEFRDGCVFVFGPNGILWRYSSRIVGTRTEDRVRPSVKWVSAYQNNHAFNELRMSGCGSYDCTNVLIGNDIPSLESLTVAGTTSDGDRVYVPKDMAKNRLIQEAYEMWYVPDSEKPSMSDFLKKYPVPLFFWKDGLGRWTRITVSDLIPAAECGKPVIYLYPEKTTRVSVRLPSFINVTVSEPKYPAQGWSVTADPNGRLTMQDGSKYGSLFWEGTGVGYDIPKDGFVLKDGEVDEQLIKILAGYGLNETESREFREFWVPHMTGAPYYRASFLTSAWSKAAPLSVSPRPQTSIRIFMDWQKLSAPVFLPEPKVETPARRGFTLVEWGGLLRK